MLETCTCKFQSYFVKKKYYRWSSVSYAEKSVTIDYSPPQGWNAKMKKRDWKKLLCFGKIISEITIFSSYTSVPEVSLLSSVSVLQAFCVWAKLLTQF